MPPNEKGPLFWRTLIACCWNWVSRVLHRSLGVFRRLGYDVFGRLIEFFMKIVLGFFKFLQALTQAAGQFGQAFCAEENQHKKQDYHYFGPARGGESKHGVDHILIVARCGVSAIRRISIWFNCGKPGELKNSNRKNQRVFPKNGICSKKSPFFSKIHLRTIAMHLSYRPPRLVGSSNETLRCGPFVS